MNNRAVRHSIAVAMALGVTHCAHDSRKFAASRVPDNRSQIIEVITPTRIPEGARLQEAVWDPDDKIRVGRGALEVAVINRPFSEVRVGPGAEFDLTDYVLAEKTQVVVLDQSGYWRKVVNSKMQTPGWVHVQSMTRSTLNDAPVVLSLRFLTSLLTVKPISTAGQFPTLASVNAQYPRGAQFFLLRRQGRKQLVYLPNIRTVAWIDQGEAL